MNRHSAALIVISTTSILSTKCATILEAAIAEAAGDDFADDRVAFGTYVVAGESDGYFTMIDNPNYNNCKLQLLQRWCNAFLDGIGTTLMSKTCAQRSPSAGLPLTCPNPIAIAASVGRPPKC